MSKRMNYRSVSDLNRTARRWARDIPRSVDLIAGIPRSGLLAANLLCLHLDVPMTDVDGLCERALHGTGHRYDGDVDAVSDADHVLVVDDSVYTGQQMTETRDRLEAREFPFEIDYGAVYVAPGGHRHVDQWAEVVTTPRAFEWNLLHHPNLGKWCVDIDGVLCRDPTSDENDDGERYREFLREVEPRVVPSKEIGWLVTCRLEKYRDQTEAWLDEHGVEYDELVMMDHPSMEARQAAGDHARYKAEVYESTGAELFIESSPAQAAEIVDRTAKYVYCYESNELVEPGALERTYDRSTRYLSRFARTPVSFSLAAGRFALRRSRQRVELASEEYFGD